MRHFTAIPEHQLPDGIREGYHVAPDTIISFGGVDMPEGAPLLLYYADAPVEMECLQSIPPEQEENIILYSVTSPLILTSDPTSWSFIALAPPPPPSPQNGRRGAQRVKR